MRDTQPKTSLTLFALAVSILLLSCRAGNKTSFDLEADFDKLVKSRLGNQYSVDQNSANQYALCQQKRSENDHARRQFTYIVVRLNDNQIVHEGVYVLGYAKWQDTDTIEVGTSPDASDRIEIKKIDIGTSKNTNTP